jgi:hypothetical protein
MRRILHILTGSSDELAGKIVKLQLESGAYEVVTADLTAPSPDYDELVREIFNSDSVEVW